MLFFERGRYSIYVLNVLLSYPWYYTNCTVTLSPTEVRVCRPARNKVVFTCSTTDGVLTWEVGSILYQFPDATSGNASKKLGQFLLAVVSNTSSVITSTATAENVTALGPTTSVVSCFGSVDESNITKRGYILARGTVVDIESC